MILINEQSVINKMRHIKISVYKIMKDPSPSVHISGL